jgi:N-acyl-D-amino-acid deacylase
MRDPDVEFALTRPWTTIGSDGAALAPDGILARSSPHPRSYGTFPRVLGHYVRERKSLSLGDAIRKMTSLPAARLKLRDRGTLATDMKADVVVFDAATISDRATFDAPHQLSTGVRWVVVNGEIVLAEGRHTNAKPGRVLRPR